MLLEVLKFGGISAGITLLIALGLVVSARPVLLSGEGGLDFSKQVPSVPPVPIKQISVAMRDGVSLSVGYVAGPSDAPLLILVHGSGWHGAQFAGLAGALTGQADILIPDLRGHGALQGAGPERRGDVEYIGQLEDDLADLIKARAKPGQKVVLAGHSSGGGLVVRFAGGAHRDLIESAILLAPFLKYNAPTTRPNSGGWARVLTRRIIGLSMLNALRIRVLNHLTVIQFNMPQAVLDGPLGETATLAYSYRMNTSYAPRSAYLRDIAQLPRFLLIVGAADEAFVAEAYAPLMREVTDKGRYHLVEGATHLGVVDAPETARLIGDFLNGQ